MNFLLSPLRRPLLLLLTTLGLLTACKKADPANAANADYSSIDEGLIKKYLADNKIVTAQRQASGLYLVPGTSNTTAAQATAGKTASVLYTGYLPDGTVFDASSQHGNTPFTFVVGARQAVAGFDEGVSLLHKGDKAQLLIPSALAYGPTGAGNGVIPPNTVLRFEVELVDVK